MLNLFKRKKHLKTDTQEFVQHLETIDYFSFLTDNKQVIKDKFVEMYNSNPNLLPIINEDIGGEMISLDYRSYFAEAIKLYELEFVTSFLGNIKQSIIFFNVPFDITECQGGWDSEKLEFNLSIKINNHNYELLANFHTGYLGYSVYKIAEMVNDILTKNKSENKVYLTGCGEATAWYFLTQQQYNYISNKIHKPENRPLEINDWQKLAEKSQMVFFKNQE